MKKQQIKKLKSETVEQYLDRLITETPELYAFRYLSSPEFKEDLEDNNPNCRWFEDYWADDMIEDYMIEDYVEKHENYQAKDDNELKKIESINQYLESINQYLVSIFDDLFDLTETYSKEFDKTYYIYKYKYCRDWVGSESVHLEIRSDYYDFMSSDEYLDRLDDGEEYDRDWVIECFGNWILYDIKLRGCDEKVLDILYKDTDFNNKYINALFKIIDIEIEEPEKIEKMDHYIPYSERVSKTPLSWVYLRKGFPGDSIYKTKEEAFAGYLADKNYGIKDLRADPESLPEWLEAIIP